MTKEQLKRYRKLQRDIQILKSELDEMEEENSNISGDVILNYSSGQGIPQTITGFDWKRYDQKQIMLEKKEKECKKILSWIESIEDGQTRSVFRYRYIEGYSWEKIAKLIGYHSNKDYVRIMIHDKYFKKSSKNKK